MTNWELMNKYLKPNKKYTFIYYRKRKSFLFRFDVFPFLILYIFLLSIVFQHISSIKPDISIDHIWGSLNYVGYLFSLPETRDNLVSGLNDTLEWYDRLNIEVNNSTKLSTIDLQHIVEGFLLPYIFYFSLLFIIHIICHLSTHWSKRMKCFICFDKISNIRENINSITHVLVKNPKYSACLCEVKYSVCVSNIDKLNTPSNKNKNSLRDIYWKNKVEIVPMNDYFIIRVNSTDFIRYRYILDKLLSESDKPLTWIRSIFYEKRQFIYNEEVSSFTKLNCPINLPISSYLNRLTEELGLSSKYIPEYNTIYGINNYDIPNEKFLRLFTEQILSPFFLFQLFCVLLWFLDEYWQMGVFTLLMLCTLEAQMTFRRLRELDELRQMRRPSCFISVFRNNKWKYILTDYILPGDIIAISTYTSDKKSSFNNEEDWNDTRSICPCDFILLSGNIVVNEAMLTGEYVPKMKVPLMNLQEDNEVSSKLFTADMNMNNLKNHTIFAGTKIIVSNSLLDSRYNLGDKVSDNRENNINGVVGSIIKRCNLETSKIAPSLNKQLLHMKYEDNRTICLGYVIRTGFNTYQGKLIRTISSSNERVTVNGFESLLFLFLLIISALIASGYVLYIGLQDPFRNRFKLLLSCIHIITSVVPPEFPITLSIAVTTTFVQLTKKNIFCTEPFRIPFGGKVDICAFDKTGTLTSDKMDVYGIFGINIENDDKESSIVLKCDTFQDTEYPYIPFLTNTIMGCCTNLTIVNGKIIGDPMDKIINKASEWLIGTSECLSNPKLNFKYLVIKRYPFSPELQRMTIVGRIISESRNILKKSSSIVESMKYAESIDTMPENKSTGMVLCKGSPEVMLKYFKNIKPEIYNEVVLNCTKKGYRILALGAKYCSLDKIDNRNRDFFENNLVFCGFLALYCPIKKYSRDVIEKLHYSGHRTIMITGDNILTGFHVAQTITMTSLESPLILTIEKDSHNKYKKRFLLKWRNHDGSFHSNYDPNKSLESVSTKYCLCILGNSLQYMLAIYNKKQVINTIRYCTIYGRMSPKDKQDIISLLNSIGNITLMCGDGTNDVGALKSSHVGISLLSGDTEAIKKEQGSLENRKPDSYDGVKFGDFQTTVESIIMSSLFFLVIRNKPLREIAPQRPPSSIFNIFVLASFLVQALIHLLVIYTGWILTINLRPSDYKASVDDSFEPNIVNTTMFYLHTAAHLATFLSNAEGYPFTMPLKDNKPLLFISGVVISFLTISILGTLPLLNNLFSLEQYNSFDLKLIILGLITIDIIGTFAINFILEKLHSRKFRNK
ncbi:cation-transporting P-type ATPase, putative [Cryptosporidium muris RN66]|uniref:Cation-transporting P-type ATPase, putative n=1 Tax=Cryptosporidium muris (strain RN66) TaxID=441375 RepID=B6ABI9_CRYMR|nr:cation-transporting P-type ATPase, putative [Cryptosporidium muris RN66]EEA05741.1 cation-transporting P-type ATPase, putative [Cryptosporidium muris RN66]|eukprot:XP_002140090.1 cation-transporting P-type ATPase [Cryptosporidium muris RN66]